MPNPGAERPLRKCTLNLFEQDCAFAETYFGQGWTVELRKVWHEYCRNHNRVGQPPRTLSDLGHIGDYDE